MSSIPYKPKIKDKSGNTRDCKFYFISYYFRGKKCQMSLQVDTMKDALKKQKQIDKLIDEGTDPKTVYRPNRKRKSSAVPLTIGELVEDFLMNWENNPEVESELTKYNVAGYLKSFLIDNPDHKRRGMLKHNTLLSNIAPETVDNILSTINQRYKKSSRVTVAVYCSWLFNYAVREGYIEKNLFKGHRYFPKQGKITDMEVHLYSIDEIGRMRKYFNTLTDKWAFFGDVILVDLNTGLRRMELFNLTWGQVDFHHRQLGFKGKGEKHRIVPLNEEAFNILLRRKEVFDNLKIKPFNDRVFWDMTNPSMMNSELKKMKEILRISGGRIHDFRHTFATNCIRNGMSPSILKEILGHSNLEMVERYTHLAGKDLHKNYEEYTRLG